MSLSDIASIVEIIGVLAILYGLFFGAMQLRQHRKQRRDLAILECTRMFEDERYTESARLVQDLPAGVTIEQIEKLDGPYVAATRNVMMKFETIGMLVHRGVVSVDAMEDLVGGSVLETWQILSNYIEEIRDTRRDARYMEWFQWLVDRLQERRSQEQEPAYLKYANWQEPKI